MNYRKWRKSVVQSLMFHKDVFTEKQAKAWARKYGYKYGKADSAKNYWRLRQMDPELITRKKWGTIHFRHGVYAIVGEPKAVKKAGKSNGHLYFR